MECQPQGSGIDLHCFHGEVWTEPLTSTADMMCGYLEYVAEHTPTTATIRNKMSQVRTYVHLAGRSMTPLDHPRVRMALKAFNRDKTDKSGVKLPSPVTNLGRGIADLPNMILGQTVAAYPHFSDFLLYFPFHYIMR